jgi:hypothetical protein
MIHKKEREESKKIFYIFHPQKKNTLKYGTMYCQKPKKIIKINIIIIIFISLFFLVSSLKLVPSLALVDVHLSPRAIVAQRFCKLVRDLHVCSSGMEQQLLHNFIFFGCFVLFCSWNFSFVSCSFNKVVVGSLMLL